MIYNKLCNIFSVTKSSLFMLKEYVLYLFGREKNTCIFNIITHMSHTNTMYVKLLQALSTKDDIFTQEQLEYMNTFSDNVPYHLRDIDNTFYTTLSKLSNNKIILSNNGNPIKSGTISLVYKATLDDKEIIVKVARKNIRETILNAIYQVNLIVKIITFFKINIQVDIDEFLLQHRELFLLQTNFLNEVYNLKKMKNNFKNIDTIIIPEVFQEFTEENNSIIVMEYINGISLDQLCDFYKPLFVEISMKFFLKSLLYDKFYHSDFHPGNVIFVTHPTPKMAIIDFGLMDELTDNEQDAMFHLVKVLTTSNDFYESVRVMIDMLIKPQNVYKNLPFECKDLIYKKISDCIRSSFYGGKMISPHDLNDINNILRNFHLSIESSFCKFILALTVLDSVTHKLGNNENYITLLKRHGQDMFDLCLLEL